MSYLQDKPPAARNRLVFFFFFSRSTSRTGLLGHWGFESGQAFIWAPRNG